MAVKNGGYSLEEKCEAVAYFNNNGVPKQIEQLLNEIFQEKPSVWIHGVHGMLCGSFYLFQCCDLHGLWPAQSHYAGEI